MGYINEIITNLCASFSHDDVVFYPESAETPLDERGGVFGVIGISGISLGEMTNGYRSTEIKAYILICGTENSTSAELISEFEGVLCRISSSEINAAEIKQSGCSYSSRIARHELRCELILRGAFYLADYEGEEQNE